MDKAMDIEEGLRNRMSRVQPQAVQGTRPNVPGAQPSQPSQPIQQPQQSAQQSGCHRFRPHDHEFKKKQGSISSDSGSSSSSSCIVWGFKVLATFVGNMDIFREYVHWLDLSTPQPHVRAILVGHLEYFQPQFTVPQHEVNAMTREQAEGTPRGVISAGSTPRPAVKPWYPENTHRKTRQPAPEGHRDIIKTSPHRNPDLIYTSVDQSKLKSLDRSGLLQTTNRTCPRITNHARNSDLASPKTMSHHPRELPSRVSGRPQDFATKSVYNQPEPPSTQILSFPVETLQQIQSCSKTYTDPITTPGIPAQSWSIPDLFTPNQVYAKPD
ncbi:hypothetical protein F511_21866 [Dorcoceras hygrometricum]|uniref:Uncharacterized protein n=1 Tax=Dorcoceras hygrometricum TaxID=472368 RepID=A0A2Z7AYN5_9LAMI|nr:hypothetical protein F511_21866 [Dorcoceras hygrometricum]